MLIKASVALLFAVVLVSAASDSTGPNAVAADLGRAAAASNHLIVGSRVVGDYLLSQQVIVKTSKWLQIVTTDLVYDAPNYQTISLVRALDQKTNGNGAYPSITRGGPGNRNVTLHFASQRGHGIHFVVEIYGR